ncbi:MAG: FAD-binding oxidoreductase, partial [Planctomycetes bacterium]|nr:FAD-binding oxidoreductase [Planctomycetota bacterium]
PTYRDDYLDLAPDVAAARRVAAGIYMLDEFLARHLDDGSGLGIDFTNQPKRVLFHGHCHQKALLGTSDTLRILRQPEGYEVTEIPSGCCGMAGSFGFEREHYDISMKVGKPRLFDVIAAAGDDVEIATAGTSCRHQIADATDRAARHWADVLADALPSPQNH